MDIAWVYDDPIPECPKVKGLIAFFNEHVDITIDGEPQPRPRTPWSDDPVAYRWQNVPRIGPPMRFRWPVAPRGR